MWFKKRQRGLLDINIEGRGILNKGQIYSGPFEVEILEETEDMYKVRFVDSMFARF